MQDLSRYIRQMRYTPFGEDGQRALSQARILVCGCGALGSVASNLLARAGVGFLRIVDRDFVETSNLQRQVLFDEADVAEGLPKAVAAAQKIQRINSQITVEPTVADVTALNIGRLADDVDLIVDGTDNFETRFLVNDYCVKNGKPWVFGGCIGAEGQSMTILPAETPCLRCLIRECPAPGTTPTCDTAGILGPIVAVVAAIEVMEAMKIAAGKRDAVSRKLTVIDMWDGTWRTVDVAPLFAQGDCPCCHKREFPFLQGERSTRTTVLCGRNSVQVTPAEPGPTLDELESRWQGLGTVTRNPFLVRLEVDTYRITVFPDGRAIIGGTDDEATAKTVYAKYVGN
ncbi:molybdopterin-synthase adenylyltransferase MoeB [Thermostilla marina]